MQDNKDYRAIIDNFEFSERRPIPYIPIVVNGSLFALFMYGFFATGAQILHNGTISIGVIFLVLAGIFFLGLISNR